MRLRSFTAPDMPSAMKMVRAAMGEQAIIVSSSPVNGKSISVTAAIDANDDYESASRKTPPPLPSPTGVGRNDRSPATDQLRFELQNILRFHNLPELYVAKMLQKITDAELMALIALQHIGGRKDESQIYRLALEKLLGTFFTFTPLTDNPLRIMLVGPPGSGKTLTTGKIATQLAVEKKPLAVITTDNKRAGGIEQLRAFTTILEQPLHVATSRAELWKQVKALPSHMNVLIDTAGCNPYDKSELADIAAYASMEDIEPVLVLPAGGDCLEAIDIVENFARMPIKRLLITRTDTARRFGAALAAAAAHGLDLTSVNYSPRIIDALVAADAPLLAQLLLRYQLQTTVNEPMMANL